MFYKQLYRYLVLWPKAILRKVDLHRYHKHLAILATLYIVLATLSAIEHRADGSWQMPIVLFYLAVLVFIIGSSELILIIDKRYKSETAKYKAISRAVSCYGVAFTIVSMCELYHFTVKY
ncbi:MAG: hypothetical protein ACRBBR_12925 [Cellvibrionaceae bacterium]